MNAKKEKEENQKQEKPKENLIKSVVINQQKEKNKN